MSSNTQNTNQTSFNNAYRVSIKEQLQKLKTNSIQHAKVDLTKINNNTLTKYLGTLNDDLNMFMKLLTANRYYPLNDRSINLLMNGDIDMSVWVGDKLVPISISDAEVVSMCKEENKFIYL